MPQFYTVPTAIGEAKIANAIALGQTVNITHMAIGDGGGTLPTPDSDREALVNEVRRAPINTSDTDEDNPNWVVVEQVLPPDVGGWTIREVGIIDEDGDLIGYANYPETYKPVLSEGSGRTQTIRFVMQVSSTAAITLKVDPAVVLATRQYVDSQRAKHEQDANAHTDEQITLSETISQAPNATNIAEALAALADFAGDSYQNIAVIDTAGAIEWPVPDELKSGRRKATVIVVGGGAAGGVSSVNGSRGAGGGAGGTAIKLVDLTGIETVTITVGTNDGTSSFGSFVSATGGKKGADYTGNTAAGGEGGDGIGGDINISGGYGSDGGNEGRPADGGASYLGGGVRGASSGGLVGGAPGSGMGGISLSSPRPPGKDGIVIVRW